MEISVKNLVNHDGISRSCRIIVNGGRIDAVLENEAGHCDYAYAVPGFIDIHTHGGNGAEVNDNSLEAMRTVNDFYLTHGTTSYLASTVTDSIERIDSILTTADRFIAENRIKAEEGVQAGCIGVHLEGPWLSKVNLGAQNPDFCIPPGPSSRELVKKWADIIRMVTFSYHTEEAPAFLDLLKQHGIIPATGHDAAVDDQIVRGFENGIRVVTHLYCVTSVFCRKADGKHLGTAETALMTKGVDVEVIADGRHITRHMWNFIRNNKPCEEILIISDSMRCAGMPEDPDKVYKLGDVDVVVDDGVAWLKDKSMYAGSVATMHSNFHRLVCDWGVSLPDAVKMTSWNQARLLGLDGLGLLKAGAGADMVFLDENLDICGVVKSGRFISAGK